MTPRQIDLARHALGLSRKTTSFRNHFVAGSGHHDYADWMDMVERGFARRRAGTPLTGDDDCFWLTRQGAEKALRPGESLCPEDFPPTSAAAA